MKKKMTEIKKVTTRKDGTKILIVPRNSDIQVGDYCSIQKVKLDQTGANN